MRDLPSCSNSACRSFAGRLSAPQQSATASGITLRLERLVIAPSMTRGVVCLDPMDNRASPQLSLTVDGEPVSLTDAR
ncbi:MAG: hypothetical protein U0521_00585 [Anaerolineae bacterium]